MWYMNCGLKVFLVFFFFVRFMLPNVLVRMKTEKVFLLP